MPLPPRRSASGQASSEYVGLLAVVVLVLAVGAARVTTPPLAAKLASAMRHGICLVGGGICTPREARASGLGACVVHLRSDAETVGGIVAVVRLRRGDTVVVERRSDGTAAVSFLDENAVGAESGAGIQIAGIGATGQSTVSAGVSFNTGRSYEFADWPAAQRFLARYADEETSAGESVNLARRVSPLHEPHRLPAPRSTTFEAGTWAQLQAELEVPLPELGARLDGDAEAQTGQLIGRRRSGSVSTWYFRMHSEATAQLGLVVGAVGAAAGGESVLEVSVRDGRPISAAVTGAAELTGELSLYGHTTDLGTLADRLRGVTGSGHAGGRGGMAMQASVSLDLTVEPNRAAVVGVLDALRLRIPPREWPQRMKSLGERLDRDGNLDVSVYRSSTSEQDQSVELALGLAVGLERVRSQRTRELVSAWSARGGPLREREDCLAADTA